MAKITETSWPKHKVTSVECRKRDLVIRIADWTRDKHEPAYDVECYVAGEYDWDISKSFCTKSAGQTKAEARAQAADFAQAQIVKYFGRGKKP